MDIFSSFNHINPFEDKNPFEQEGSYTYEIIPSQLSPTDEECQAAIKKAKQSRFRLDKDALLGQVGSAAIHLAILLTAMFYYPSLSLAQEAGELDNEKVEMLTQALSTIAEKELDREKSDSTSSDSSEEKASSSNERHSTAMAVPSKDGSKGSARIGSDRVSALKDAASFGMISVLTDMGSLTNRFDWGNIPTSGSSSLNQNSLWADDITGGGGLSLSGIGEGSNSGTGFISADRIGNGGNSLFGGAFGGREPRFKKKHETLAPIMRAGQTSVSGTGIPADIVQRIVRQNFGRFRSCYEQGLRSNPTLAGRVSTKFIIGRDGQVASAQNGGSDLPSNEVVGCVVRSFYGLSFPKADSLVTVTYPIMFSNN